MSYVTNQGSKSERKGPDMRRIQIQKRKPQRVAKQLSGAWKPIAELPVRAKSTTLSDQENAELQQRRRLESLILEHATA